MESKKRYVLVMIILAFLCACSGGELKVLDYLEWVNNPTNGLKVAKELNDFKFELLYKPSEFIAINEQQTIDLDQERYHKRVEELEDLQYYTLKIETLTGQEMMRSGIESEQEYSHRLQYFSDIAQYNMWLIDGNDTLTCVLFHFERNYGVAPYNNIVLAFPKTNELNNSKTFTFNEQVLGVGKVNIKIDKKDINNIPQVILN